MKEGKNKEKKSKKGKIKEKKNKVVPVLIATIIVLIIGLGLEAYMLRLTVLELNQEKDMNNQLNMENQDLILERDTLKIDKDVLQEKYDLLEEDVQNIYKSCITQNGCKGRFPGVRWYCNNVGDETVDNPSHTCICDSSCNLKTTPITS
jgi:cell division protein FtsL